jgi:hypothetical protein
MKEKIEALLAKYYEGDTTLAEEKELRELLLNSAEFEEERQFFHGLDALRVMAPSARPAPRMGTSMPLWQKVAAVLVLCGGLSWWFIDQQIKKEEKAYAQVMEAFNMIQENMSKGTTSLDALKEMRHLNKPGELFNINNQEEQ